MKHVALTAILLAFGCTGVTGPDRVRTLGVVVHYGDGPELVVPDTVMHGQDFIVEVTTYGSRYCHEIADTDVDSHPARAVVRPYDYETRREACDDALVSRRHTATLRFEDPGIARVVVRGRETPSDRVLEITREVIVE